MAPSFRSAALAGLLAVGSSTLPLSEAFQQQPRGGFQLRRSGRRGTRKEVFHPPLNVQTDADAETVDTLRLGDGQAEEEEEWVLKAFAGVGLNEALCASTLLSLGFAGVGFSLPSPASFVGPGALAFSIGFHEFGHFLAARSLGIKPAEFSIGFGPPVLSYVPADPQETKFCLRLIPLAGYVAFKRAIEPTDERETVLLKGKQFLENRRTREQLIVLAGGILFNLLLAWLCYVALEAATGNQVKVALPGVEIMSVQENGPAASAGLLPGDILLEADGVSLREGGQKVMQKLVDIVTHHANMQVPFVVQRGTETLNLIGTPVPKPGGLDGSAGFLGFSFRPEFETHTDPWGGNPLLLVQHATSALVDEIGRSADAYSSGFVAAVESASDALKKVMGGQGGTGMRGVSGAPNMIGPIALMGMVSDIARVDVWASVASAASINIQLALFNLLPIPGLDGGAMIEVLLEKARGRKFAPSTKLAVRGVAGFLLLCVTASAIVGDVTRAVRGG
uniref:PDZ domain-containing protein n=1 Tax=Chromera velia CCMP2878 TaxID=1169474 RepID=A0A0G4I237_9ALVE|eukprot:Cvel_10310.t1-p1 / transcript=Cvel_10310.t1 / gene=Cvel_10310 / organism=Chromera_velia_CCMP2878 / gene_product=Putative zinc metalloprotease slr1821, putative / transcript_product=Putative zinc metalloprotease slr1821, putative / location=Cvel_scaffold619:14795-17540(-) / protein_length=506 / sequence_SO=supercontig / SO=protein_coding / is_pseudo=false